MSEYYSTVSRSQTCERRTDEVSGRSSRGTSNVQAAPAAVSAQGNWADTNNYCFGIDVGGTPVKIGLFDEKGALL